MRQSPLHPLTQNQNEIRFRLQGDELLSFELLRELKDEGHTDYFAHILPTIDGKRSRAVIYVTDEDGGFSDEHLQIFREAQPVLAWVAEVHSQVRRSRTLLDTYLGKNTGQQILDGKIARGDGETLHAVVWFCDLRGFTTLSEQLPRDELLDMLNDFFGAMTSSIEHEGGEVLKFIGDAMLAIFPIEHGEAGKIACQKAMKAVEAVNSKTLLLNAQREEAKGPPIDFGVALHVGEVHYGNIGGKTRLDFTVIGPAVNLASRIESKTKVLGESVLVSDAFFQASSDGLVPCSREVFKGVAEPQNLYRLVRDDEKTADG
ncbi:MAG: adenylate/guanylate cyclase domain-containing protein [Deltaproteobacteria bacterium]|nr:adenylate/guanylate cyclase domain-containing protein [Deltaproteobacteria bacterium]